MGLDHVCVRIMVSLTKRRPVSLIPVEERCSAFMIFPFPARPPIKIAIILGRPSSEGPAFSRDDTKSVDRPVKIS